MADKSENMELLAFVIETKEGKYVEVPSYALDYVRVEDSVEAGFIEEVYSYNNSYYC